MNIDKYLVTKVSWCYYMENMTQEQIAKMLGITRFKVIKMLEQAREQKIVQFRVKGAGVNCMQIEKDLIKDFGLTDAFVIPSTGSDLVNSLSMAASCYLENKLTSNDIIGFGWGQTISKTISKIKVEHNFKTSFVSLTGGVRYYIPYSENEELSPESLTARLYVIPTPFCFSSSEMVTRTKEEPSVKVILQLAKMANFLLVGIGTTSSEATVLKEHIISNDYMEILKRNGAVGDILGQYFDADGKKLNADIHNRIMSIDINSLKEKQNVIGIAGGKEKAEAVKGAMNGGYIKILITDEETALDLLKKKAEGN